jgi:hypothetical protein
MNLLCKGIKVFEVLKKERGSRVDLNAWETRYQAPQPTWQVAMEGKKASALNIVVDRDIFFQASC